MKTVTHIFTIFCIALLFYPFHMHGMKKEGQLLALPEEQCNENNLFLLSS